MMGTEKKGFFCGGLFFSLILEARKPKISKKEARNTGSDGMTDPDVMLGLTSVINPKLAKTGSHGNSLKKDTSEYKQCIKEGGSSIPFNETAIWQGFDADIRNSYQSVLARMMDFVDCFIDKGRIDWLVKVLLDVLRMDEGIQAEDILFVSKDGRGIAKKDILDLTSIDFQPFLLGILHYVIINRQSNLIGKQMYDQWFVSTGEKRPRKYSGTLGVWINKAPYVQWLEELPPIVSEDEPEDLENISPEASEDEPEVLENVSPEEAAGGYGAPKKEDTVGGQTTIQTQIINNPTIVNQYGKNNLHLDQLETLNSVGGRIKMENERQEMQPMPTAVPPANTNGHTFTQTGPRNVAVGYAANVVNNVYVLGSSTSEKQSPINTSYTSYYNLFVLYHDVDLSTGYFIMQKDRVLEKGWIQEEIRQRYAGLTSADIEELKTFPAIIVNENTNFGETREGQLATIAAITGIRVQENGVKVHFQPRFYISQNQLTQSAERFALGRPVGVCSLNHTHWSIKNIDLFEELREANIELISAEDSDTEK